MVDATRLGAWLRSGEGIGWLAAGIMPNSLYRVPFFYLFLAYVFFYCSFLFVVSVLFRYLFLFCFLFLLSLELCRCSSQLFLSSRPRTGLVTTLLLGTIKARSVNVKKTTTTTTTHGNTFGGGGAHPNERRTIAKANCIRDP